VSPLRGEKPQNWPLSKLNTGRFALRAMLPVIIKAIVDSILRPPVHSHPPFPADNAYSMGKNSRRQAMRSIVNVPEEDRATDIGSPQKFGKDRACGSGDILAADRQTHRHTDTQTNHRQTYSSQYFATAPAGEVITQ